MGRHLRGLFGDRDERWLGDGGANAQGEREGKEPAERSLAGKGVRHAFAERKEAEIEASHEEAETQEDKGKPRQSAAKIGKRLAQYEQLEERDDHDDRCQVPGATREKAQQRS
jgi:hypothetical protein